jgi:hypothetical protein
MGGVQRATAVAEEFTVHSACRVQRQRAAKDQSRGSLASSEGAGGGGPLTLLASARIARQCGCVGRTRGSGRGLQLSRKVLTFRCGYFSAMPCCSDLSIRCCPVIRDGLAVGVAYRPGGGPPCAAQRHRASRGRGWDAAASGQPRTRATWIGIGWAAASAGRAATRPYSHCGAGAAGIRTVIGRATARGGAASARPRARGRRGGIGPDAVGARRGAPSGFAGPAW